MSLVSLVRSNIETRRIIWLISTVLIVVALIAIVLFNSGANTNTSVENTTSQPSTETKTTEDSQDTTEEPLTTQTIKPSTDPLSEKSLAPHLGSQDYCSNLEKACFTYPRNWSSVVVETHSTNKEEVHITSPDKTTLVWQYGAPTQLEGSCNASDPNAWTNYFEAMPNISSGIHFVATGPLGQYIDHLGIINDATLNQHPLGDNGKCNKLYVPTFISRSDPTILVSLRTLDHDLINENDKPTVIAIIKSFRYTE